jgi:hypothetical protein
LRPGDRAPEFTLPAANREGDVSLAQYRGELDAPLPPPEANAALNAKDGFTMTAADVAVATAHPTQLVGHFLIDRDGIVRWAQVEAQRGLGELGKFPTPAEVLTAVRGLG